MIPLTGSEILKIGFFLDNTKYSYIDFSHPDKGNPGIRGTEYMTWQAACGLGKDFAEVFLFAPYIGSMPGTVTAVACADETEALEHAKRIGLDMMVIATLGEKPEIIDAIDHAGVNCVVWSHLLETYALADAAADCRYIKRYVCVSRQQYERLRDHPVFEKSAYIYNGMTFSPVPPEIPHAGSKRNIVTYIGTLMEHKGFHVLAHVWQDIKKRVPDAELFVLDSGNRGHLIAEGDDNLLTQYEKDLRQSLSDRNGHIDKSVHFVGCAGEAQKEELISQTKIGVANPYGAETFSLAAIELEAYGVPVVAKKSFGLLDSVQDGKTGILINNERELANAVVRLLCDNDLCDKMGVRGMKFVRGNYHMTRFLEEWKKLLTEVCDDIPAKPDYRFSYPFINYKWLRELSRLWKKTPFGKNTPSMMKLEGR